MNEQGQNQIKDPKARPRRLDEELDRLEVMIEALRVQYEQYFVDILPHPPEKERTEVAQFIRKMLKAPFKNSALRFRLRTIILRFQTYCTYWERVIKQREDGTYVRDIFKADLREKLEEELRKAESRAGKAEQGLHALYNSYETALKKAGAKTDHLNFDAFKKSLVKQAKQLKEQHGVKKIQYSIVNKDGKIVLKTSIKK